MIASAGGGVNERGRPRPIGHDAAAGSLGPSVTAEGIGPILMPSPASSRLELTERAGPLVVPGGVLVPPPSGPPGTRG